jgi:hypothetical protein
MSNTDEMIMPREKMAETEGIMSRMEEEEEKRKAEKRRRLEERLKELAKTRQHHDEKVVARRIRMVSRVDPTANATSGQLEAIAAHLSMSAFIMNILTDLHQGQWPNPGRRDRYSLCLTICASSIPQ